MRVKLLAPFYKGLLFLIVIPLAAQTSSSKVIALDEIELRPLQILKLLKEHLVRHLPRARTFTIETVPMNKEWQYGLGFVALLAFFILVGKWVASH